MSTTKKYTVGVIVVSFVALLLIAMFSTDFKVESHVARVDWLPSAASDITYARRTGFGWSLTYECGVGEEEFRSLAEKEGWPIHQATNVAVSGLRLNLKLPELTNALGEPTYTIERAFIFERRQPNGGGTTVVYDRERSRLFFNKSHR